MRTFFIVLLSVIASIAATGLYFKNQGGVSAPQETAYDRVLRTGVIRCGYGVFAPYFTRDPNTGTLGGIWHDLSEAIAERLELKIEWTEEVAIPNIAVALSNGRIDMYCGGLWTNGPRIKNIRFIEPSAYEPIYIYVRKDDARFDTDVTKGNAPDIRISTFDGDAAFSNAIRLFPKATVAALPDSANYGDMFEQVTTKKADMTFAAPAGANVYLLAKPDVLRPLTQHSIGYFPESLGVAYGDDNFATMITTAQRDVLNNGIMDEILKKHEVKPGDFLRITQPWKSNAL